MKPKLIWAISIISLLGCNFNKSIEVSPILMEKLEMIVGKYETFSEENKSIMINPPVYSVEFREIEGDCFVLIGTDLAYYPELQECMIYKDNLIAFYGTNTECNKFLKGNDIPCDELSQFEVYSEDMGNYRSRNWVYKVVGDSLTMYDQSNFKVE